MLTSKQLPKKRRSWKHDLFAFRKQTIEFLFQRVIQSGGLKECRVKGEGRNGAFVLANVWLYPSPRKEYSIQSRRLGRFGW